MREISAPVSHRNRNGMKLNVKTTRLMYYAEWESRSTTTALTVGLHKREINCDCIVASPTGHDRHTQKSMKTMFMLGV